jgi:hypothetical protein
VGCEEGELNDVSGDAVLLKVDVFGPGAECGISTRVIGVDGLPGPESRGGEYLIPILVGGGEASPRAFGPGLVGVDADRPWLDVRECISGGSVKGGGPGGPEGAYRVGDRVCPGKPNEDDGLRGIGGLLRGGERPNGEPRPIGPGNDDDDEGGMREPCSSDHGSRGEWAEGAAGPFSRPDELVEDIV